MKIGVFHTGSAIGDIYINSWCRGTCINRAQGTGVTDIGWRDIHAKVEGID